MTNACWSESEWSNECKIVWCLIQIQLPCWVWPAMQIGTEWYWFCVQTLGTWPRFPHSLTSAWFSRISKTCRGEHKLVNLPQPTFWRNAQRSRTSERLFTVEADSINIDYRSWFIVFVVLVTVPIIWLLLKIGDGDLRSNIRGENNTIFVCIQWFNCLRFLFGQEAQNFSHTTAPCMAMLGYNQKNTSDGKWWVGESKDLVWKSNTIITCSPNVRLWLSSDLMRGCVAIKY